MSNHFNEGLQGKSYKFRSKPPIDPTKEEDVIDKFLNLNSYTPVQEGSPEGFPNSQQLDPGTNMQHSSSFDGLQPTPSSKKPAFLDESSMFLSSNSESYSNQASNNSYNFIGSSQDFPTVPSLETPPQQPYIHFEDAISDNKSPTSAESTAPLIQIDKAFAEYISLQSEMTEFPQPTTMDRYSSNQFERDVTQYNTNPSFFLQPQAAGQYIQTESSTGSDLSASNSPYLSAVESIVSGDLNERGDDLEGLQMSEDIRQLSLSAIATPNINLTEHNLREQERISSAPPIVIENPENLAKRTPSLFSASSSRASSPNRSGSGSYTGGPHITSGDHSFTPEISIKVEDTSNPHTVDSSSYSTPDHEKLYTGNYLQADDAGSFLSPDDPTYNSMRLGRQRRHSESSSRSRSRSTSRSNYSDNDSDYESDASLSREKLSELAAPPSPNKKSQKNPASFACPVCEKKFTRPYNLKSHLRTHTNERPFLCTVCGKAFARQHDRKRHEELHSGEKKYQCRGSLADGITIWGCGKRFARTDALRRHFQTESGKNCIKPLMDEIENEKKVSTTGAPSKEPTNASLPVDYLDISDYNNLLDQILSVQSKATVN